MSNKQSTILPSTSLALFGCCGGFVAALGLFIAGVSLFVNAGGEPLAFRVALVVGGLVLGWACYLALFRNRAGWSFAVAICGTLTLAFLFGAPSVADGLGTTMAVGGAPSLLFLLTTIFLAIGGDEY